MLDLCWLHLHWSWYTLLFWASGGFNQMRNARNCWTWCFCILPQSIELNAASLSCEACIFYIGTWKWQLSLPFYDLAIKLQENYELNYKYYVIAHRGLTFWKLLKFLDLHNKMKIVIHQTRIHQARIHRLRPFYKKTNKQFNKGLYKFDEVWVVDYGFVNEWFVM